MSKKQNFTEKLQSKITSKNRLEAGLTNDKFHTQSNKSLDKIVYLI